MANAETLALIKVVTAHHVSKGRKPDCPLLMWLQQQGEREPDAVRAEMVQRDDWKPIFTCEALAITRSPSAQAIYARALAALPWVEGRAHIERIFRDPAISLAQEATDILVAKLASAHPNPKAFLLQPTVLARLAAGVSVDISDLRAPDFPALANRRGRITRAGLAAN